MQIIMRKFMERKLLPVLQDEPFGCGIACVATLAGKTYAEVKEYANSTGIFAGDEKLYSDTRYVRSLLSHYGIKVSNHEQSFDSWEKLPDTALLSIKYRIEEGKPLWHWVVFVRTNSKPAVFDPARYLANNIRTDFEIMQPEWFIEILKNDA